TDGNSLASVTENFITASTGDGILIDAAAGTIGAIFNNDLSGNTGLAVHNLSASVVDASGNWWGSNTSAVVAAKAGANVNYSPWLDSGIDTDVAPGFQGDFSTLHVDATGSIQEAINLVKDGGTVYVAAGTYNENLTIGKSLTLLG